MLDDYLPKLKNKEKIWEITEKIVSTELKINKYESRRLIIKECIKEMEKKMFKLHKKSLKYPKSQKIGDEIEDTETKLEKGIKISNDLNDRISRKEIALIKLKQERQREINVGLKKYLDLINLKYEKLQKEDIEHDESHKDKENKLKEIRNEIEHIKRLIEIESNSK